MFGSPENSHIVAWILTRKLYEYLDGSDIAVEVSDGEVMLDAHLPPADVVDRCDATLKVCLIRSSVTRLGDLLDFVQLFKAFGNNYFAQISYILRQFL